MKNKNSFGNKAKKSRQWGVPYKSKAPKHLARTLGEYYSQGEEDGVQELRSSIEMNEKKLGRILTDMYGGYAVGF